MYLNQGDGTWEQSFGLLDGSSYNIVEFGDFNRDGYKDFFASYEYGSAYFGDCTGNVTSNDNGLPVLSTYESRNGISTGDVNNDGACDIAFVYSAGGIEIYLWDENFTSSWIALSGELPQSGSFDFTDLADMNGDGYIDLAAIENATLSVWLGDGEGNRNLETSISFDPTTDAKAFRVGGDFNQNGLPDLVVLAEEGSWPSYQNFMYCFREDSPADSLWIKPFFPKGNENFYPGSVPFIEWTSEVPAGENSTVTIEISAFGQEVPWWLLAENLPNNGKHQWTVPDFGSDQVYLKFTVNHESGSATAITQVAFNIFGNPTSIGSEHIQTEIAIYPNPGSDYIFLLNFESLQSINFKNITGKEYFQLEKPNDRIDMKHLGSGIYFYEIITENGSRKHGKWIKNKR